MNIKENLAEFPAAEALQDASSAICKFFGLVGGYLYLIDCFGMSLVWALPLTMLLFLGTIFGGAALGFIKYTRVTDLFQFEDQELNAARAERDALFDSVAALTREVNALKARTPWPVEPPSGSYGR